MKKIYHPTLTQKEGDIWLRYWMEPMPTLTSFLPSPLFNAFTDYFSDWQKSFKEVRIHPTQLSAFEKLSKSIWRAYCNVSGTFESVLKEGIELPPENIIIDYEPGTISGGIKYAFLVEGKKGTPEGGIDVSYDMQACYNYVGKIKACTDDALILGALQDLVIDVLQSRMETRNCNRPTTKDAPDKIINKTFQNSFVGTVCNKCHNPSCICPKQSNKDQEDLWEEIHEKFCDWDSVYDIIEELKSKYKITKL